MRHAKNYYKEASDYPTLETLVGGKGLKTSNVLLHRTTLCSKQMVDSEIHLQLMVMF